MFKTLGDLVNQTEIRLSLVPGLGVQKYAEDPIALLIIEGFNFCVKQTWWPHLRRLITVNLDGSTGTITSDLYDDLSTEGIHGLENIRNIYVHDTPEVLQVLPTRFNPTSVDGEWPLFYCGTSNSKRPFKVYPETAKGPLVIEGRAFKGKYTLDDEIPFDPDCLTNYAAWKYATDDGANQQQAELFGSTFQQLLGKLVADTRPDYIAYKYPFGPAYDNREIFEWQVLRK